MAFAAVVLVVLGVVFPKVVLWRLATSQGNEADRFSGKLQILNTESVQYQSRGENGGILVPQIGGKMNNSRSELVNARAQRAALVARRHAAAQRRVALTALMVAALVLVLIVAAAGKISLLWALLPTAGVGAALYYSRRSTVADRKQDVADMARIRKLKQEALAADRPAPKANRSWRQLSRLTKYDPGVTEQVEAKDQEQDQQKQEEAKAGSTAQPVAGNERPRKYAKGMTWSPMPVPAPTHKLKPLVQPRTVAVEHMRGDTPAAGVAVPYRPRTVRKAEVAMTSAEVARTALVRMDGDDMLEARRANAS